MIPDKLITSAVEACRRVMADAVVWKDVDSEQADPLADACARAALAATFAVLPECPDPIDPTCCQNGEWRGHACQYHQGYEDGWDALARELGES